MKNVQPIIVLAAAALLLTGCGNSNGEQPPTATEAAPVTSSAATQPTSVAPTTKPAPSATDSAGGGYVFTTDYGAIGKLQLPSDPDPEIESLLKKVDAAGAAQVHYATVRVANREGFEPVNMYDMRAYDDAGKEYVFVSDEDLLDAVQSEADIDTETESGVTLYNEFVDLINARGDGASPGEVKEFVMVSLDDLPDEFARISVQAHGADGGNEVFPESWAEDQGIPLDF